MSYFDSMLQRNKDFAAEQSAADTLMPSLSRALPNVKAVIIGCADMRVDPAHVLGIRPGEAVVMRNIGGTIHELTLREYASSSPLSRRSKTGQWAILEF
ncbi:MAG: carbonic anhydrase [Terriglobia bacterium]